MLHFHKRGRKSLSVKAKLYKISVFLIVAVILTSFLYQQQLENRQKDELVTLVDQAVQMINEKGESAFPELRSSSWFHNDSYVFVWRLDGIRVVYPPDPTGEGKKLMNDVKQRKEDAKKYNL